MSQQEHTPFYNKYHTHLHDAQWYSTLLNRRITSIDISMPSAAGGHHAEFYKIILTVDDTNTSASGSHPTANQPHETATTIHLAAKLLGSSDPKQGYEREIPIYQNFLTPLIDAGLMNAPKLYFADYDPTVGGKVLLFDMIDGVQCGLFFGDASPHNHSLDWRSMTSQFPHINPILITKLAFQQIAHLHGRYWNIDKAKVPAYIKGLNWIIPSLADTPYISPSDQQARALGQQEYNTMIDFAREQWPLRFEKRPNTIIPQYLSDIITHSLHTSTWELFSSRTNTRPYTIIHSDFYPANALLHMKDGVTKLYTIDYELTGIGQGPQDLAQWVISHLDPSLRREHEDDLLAAYYTTLVQTWEREFGDQTAAELRRSYTLEDVKFDYVNGGGKWIWLIAICVGFADQGIPDKLYQHFINQLTDFFQTHGVQADEHVPLPRS